MPKIDFCFSGWVRGAQIEVATGGDFKDDVCMKDVDVSKLSAEQVVAMLNSGKLTISLAKFGDHLRGNDDVEVDMFDYEISKD